MGNYITAMAIIITALAYIITAMAYIKTKENHREAVKKANTAYDEASKLINQFKKQYNHPDQFRSATDIHDKCIRLQKTVEFKFSRTVAVNEHASEEVNRGYIKHLNDDINDLQQDLLKRFQEKADETTKALEEDKKTLQLNATYEKIKKKHSDEIRALKERHNARPFLGRAGLLTGGMFKSFLGMITFNRDRMEDGADMIVSSRYNTIY